VNAETPDACGLLRAAFIRGETLGTIEVKRGTLTMYAVLIFAVHHAHGDSRPNGQEGWRRWRSRFL
jgi:hypothetical protein